MHKGLEETIDQESAGKRLDIFLRRRFPDYSRTFIQSQIELGHVTINGKVLDSGFRLRLGDKVICQPFAAKPLQDRASREVPFSVLLEDEDILVINKPKSIPV